MRFSLVGLYLLPLIVTVASRVNSPQLIISGSAYNHHYSSDRQYSSSPGEKCKLAISKPNGEYKEALVDCNLMSSFIWEVTPSTIQNNQHVKNTTKVTVNRAGNSSVSAVTRPEALRFSIFANTNSAKVRHNFNQHDRILKNGSKPYYMNVHELASSANLQHNLDQHNAKSGSNSDNGPQNENNKSGLAGNANRRLGGLPQAHQHEFTLKNGSKPYYMNVHELASSANLHHNMDQHNAKSGSYSHNEFHNENNKSGLAGKANRLLGGWPQAHQHEFTLKNGSKPYYMNVHELASSANLRHKDQHNTKSGSNSGNGSMNQNNISGLAGNENRRIARWPLSHQHELILKNGSKPYYMDLHELALMNDVKHYDVDTVDKHRLVIKNGPINNSMYLRVNVKSGSSSANIHHNIDQHNAKSESNSHNEFHNENNKRDLAGNENRRTAGWPQTHQHEFILKNGSKPYYMNVHELASSANLRHKDQHNTKSGSNSDSEPQNKNNKSGLTGNENRRLATRPQMHQQEFILKNVKRYDVDTVDKHRRDINKGPINNSMYLRVNVKSGSSSANLHHNIDQHNAKSGSNSDNGPQNQNNKSGFHLTRSERFYFSFKI